jgi:hypothetical protein
MTTTMTQTQSQTQNQSAQTTPNRNLISDKELHYMKDFMSWELLAMKKCYDAANRCTDTDVQNALKEVGKNHKQHYDQLLTQLQ